MERVRTRQKSGRPLSIAYVCHYFPPEPAAPAARVYEFARAWVAMGQEVTVLTAFPNHPTGVIPPRYKGRARQEEWLDGIRVLRNWVYAVPNRGVGKRGLNHLSFMLSCLLLGLPRVRHVDVVIASSPTLFSALAGLVIARIRRKPFVLEVRDLWPDVFADMGVMRNPLALGFFRVLARFLYSSAARIVVVTHAFAERLREQGVPAKKLAVIPHGADMRLFSPAADGREVRRRLNLGPDQFVVAYVGSHGLSHGLSALMDAAARDPETLYLMVGDGAERDRLVAERDSRALDNVLMLPSVPRAEVPAFYAAADALVVPLRDVPIFDSFVPSKLFEILLTGRPIIGAVRGEARDILLRSGGALLVEPEDGVGMSLAAARLRSDPGLRSELGEKGRMYACAHHDRDLLAGAYLDLLREVEPA